MKILNQFCILSILFISTLAYTDSIHGKHQVLNNKNINIDNNKFNQAKLYIKDGVIEFKSIEYNRIFPAYRFNKDPIKIETYEAIFLDANEKQIFQVCLFDNNIYPNDDKYFLCSSVSPVSPMNTLSILSISIFLNKESIKILPK